MANIKHGESGRYTKTPEYKIWSLIKSRCYNKNVINYEIYGGRGIEVCPEWKNSYEQFLKDMRRRPSSKHTIERIDNNKDYSKDNCKWILRKYQNRNKRNNVVFNGEIASEASIRLGGERGLIWWRMNHGGWSIKKAFTTPVA